MNRNLSPEEINSEREFLKYLLEFNSELLVDEKIWLKIVPNALRNDGANEITIQEITGNIMKNIEDRERRISIIEQVLSEEDAYLPDLKVLK